MIMSLPMLGPSAHVDTFARDNLPPPKTQTGKIQRFRLRPDAM
jgi:acyl-coenzyme A synthetase/AMP-(fatty) acid ligase